MTLTTRLLTLGSVLIVLCCAQLVIQRHVRAAGQPVPGKLLAPLDQLPFDLANWRGRDRPITDPNTKYGDEHLQREYSLAGGAGSLVVWIGYSRVGKDRTHHPEICMSVAGQPEDRSARQQVELTGTGDPAQQYRFGRTGSSQWVYYWYYTLATPLSPENTWLQRLYQQLRYPSASVTVEVFAPNVQPGDERTAQEFVRLLDKAVRPLVGPNAKRGSRRLSVIRIEAPT